MAIRAALLIGDDATIWHALRTAFRSLPAGVELCLLATAGNRQGMLAQLLRCRPDLVIAEACGPHDMDAAVYRTLFPRSRLLLCVAGQQHKFGFLQRLLLTRADGIFADCQNMARAVARLQIPGSRIYGFPAPADLDAFLALPCDRAGEAAHRVIYAGELSPISGAADLLLCLGAWAEQHPDRAVEIWWAGEGDLSGVLDAQILPDNLRQSFLGCPHPGEMAEILGACGIMVAPGLDDHDMSLVPEALAAGLVVLGSRRAGAMTMLPVDDLPDWGFDPLRQEELFAAIDRALSAPATELDQMRETGRAAMRRCSSGGLAANVDAAIAAVLPHSRAMVAVLP